MSNSWKGPFRDKYHQTPAERQAEKDEAARVKRIRKEDRENQLTPGSDEHLRNVQQRNIRIVSQVIYDAAHKGNFDLETEVEALLGMVRTHKRIEQRIAGKDQA